ncbi:MAG: exopolysaccharide biosynthesis protein [Gracilibacter sp. BRH_c7a]|nr:MAG: exopolysaccharide biosynthesis protein [Gracilibacter sp. BRH_c7a]
MSKKRVGFYFLLFNLFFFLISSPFIIFYGPFQSLKGFTVNTILTSRHPQVVDFFLSQEKINEIAKRNKQNPIIVEPVIHTKENIIVDNKNHIRIENIEGKYFKGKVMLVKDPSQVKIAVTKEIGTAGQRLSEMVLDNQAIAGINGGGFYDPNAQGNGAFPDGITVQDGIVVHNNTDDVEVNIIGFDNQDRLILKNMNIIQVYANKIQNAVTFNPNLILDNEPLIQGDGGWGIAPRTGIGQKSDGTVIFVVIDGRQPSWSMGATLRDLMNVFIEYGAVNAANLDGGSSTEMIYNDQIINSLWNIYGERYIPTAFVVLPSN